MHIRREITMAEQLEKNIEAASIRELKKLGAIDCYKLNGKGQRAKPDRLIIMPKGHCFFIEFKRPSGTVTELQAYEHKKLIGGGHAVYICRSKEEAINAYKKEEGKLR